VGLRQSGSGPSGPSWRVGLNASRLESLRAFCCEKTLMVQGAVVSVLAGW
jgi:hypothetical protein